MMFLYTVDILTLFTKQIDYFLLNSTFRGFSQCMYHHVFDEFTFKIN